MRNKSSGELVIRSLGPMRAMEPATHQMGHVLQVFIQEQETEDRDMRSIAQGQECGLPQRPSE